MGIARKIRQILTVLICLPVGIEICQSAEILDYGLLLSPDSCLVIKDSKECQIPITIRWRTQSTNDYCLFEKDQKLPIKCWQDSQLGEHIYQVLSDQDFKVELREQGKTSVIYSADFEIYRKVKTLKKRRRNPWSFY